MRTMKPVFQSLCISCSVLLSRSHCVRQFEVLVEHVSHLVDFEERGAAAPSEAAAQICNLVLHLQVALLSQHSQRCHELVLRLQFLMLEHRNHSVAQGQQSLHPFLYADGEYGVRTAESRQVACCASV